MAKMPRSTSPSWSARSTAFGGVQVDELVRHLRRAAHVVPGRVLVEAAPAALDAHDQAVGRPGGSGSSWSKTVSCASERRSAHRLGVGVARLQVDEELPGVVGHLCGDRREAFWSRACRSVSVSKPKRSSVRPTKWVTPWLSAASRSCSSAGHRDDHEALRREVLVATSRTAAGGRPVPVDDDGLAGKAGRRDAVRAEERVRQHRLDRSAADGAVEHVARMHLDREDIDERARAAELLEVREVLLEGGLECRDRHAVEDGVGGERVPERSNWKSMTCGVGSPEWIRSRRR